jgi:hypothetical protein
MNRSHCLLATALLGCTDGAVVQNPRPGPSPQNVSTPSAHGDPSAALLVGDSSSEANALALHAKGAPSTHELALDVRVEIADVSLLVDAAAPMGATIRRLNTAFPAIEAGLSVQLSDTTYGMASYTDYHYGGTGNELDRPFVLEQQQSEDPAHTLHALANLAYAQKGRDGPESAHEAVYQAFTGRGYDQHCDGQWDEGYDVLPFSASSADAFGGLDEDAGGPGPGSAGGMGFRDRTLPLLLLVTDNELRDPAAGYASPGGCGLDAGARDSAEAALSMGGRVIGVAANMWPDPGQYQMQALAQATHTMADLNHDGVPEPAVVEWDGRSPSELADSVVTAVEAVLAEQHFEEITVELEDPHGLLLAVSIDRFEDVAAGDRLNLYLTVAGTVLGSPSAVTEEAALLLVGDGLVLQRHVLFIGP